MSYSAHFISLYFGCVLLILKLPTEMADARSLYEVKLGQQADW